MRNYDNNSKNLNFDNYFLNVNFSKTLADTDLKFSLHIPQIHSEGTVSQISYFWPSFYFVLKIGKRCETYRKNIF